MRRQVRGKGGRLTAWAGALALTLALLGWGAAPASAGGPTSAFITSPTSGEAAGLYYSDQRYNELESLLQAGTLGKPPRDATAVRQIHVTWLIHDTDPWRVDWIYPVAEGTDVWVQRTVNITESTGNSWHLAPDPGRLRALLSDLGVMGEIAPEDGGAPFSLREVYTSGAETAVTAGSPEPVAEETVTAVSGTSAAGTGDGTDWWWALPGAAAGATLALVLRPFAVRLPWSGARGEPGPRQELRDV
ncbi:hypothetical protein [Streptomyces sp. CC219B]|uniref:hypothetical protein n=1 Tax=Streptomyces sp. CC219B TaxID=3044574 RepID=UPI0024A9301C|nr:hypothetical protein [Streptomyces sp. CC219B]